MNPSLPYSNPERELCPNCGLTAVQHGRLDDFAHQLKTSRVSPAESRIAPRMRRYGFVWNKTLCPYIVDFYHPERKIVVEIDGAWHTAKQKLDVERSQHLIRLYDVIIFRIPGYMCFDRRWRNAVGLIMGFRQKIPGWKQDRRHQLLCRDTINGRERWL